MNFKKAIHWKSKIKINHIYLHPLFTAIILTVVNFKRELSGRLFGQTFSVIQKYLFIKSPLYENIKV